MAINCGIINCNITHFPITWTFVFNGQGIILECDWVKCPMTKAIYLKSFMFSPKSNTVEFFISLLSKLLPAALL